MKVIIFILLLLSQFLAGCQAAPDRLALQTVLPSFTPYPTYTALPPLATLTPYPTYTPMPTQTAWLVTATLSATPANTATFTATPTRTWTALPTRNYLQMEKGAGNYLVNVDIFPGIWRNNGNSDACYWKRSNRSGGIIEEYHGKGGGTMTIAVSDYRVEFAWECGIWTFLGSS